MSTKWFRSFKASLRDGARWFAANTPDPLPLRHSLKGYTLGTLTYDLKAALNVALLGIPQAMAYASIAGLPISYGIIGGTVACLLAPLFASSRFTSLGPTNATALMVFSFFAASPLLAAEKAVMMPILVGMVGLFCVVGSFLKVAELLQYVSRSVLVGYITGAGVLIIGNQVKHLLGVKEALATLPPPPNFFVLLYDLGLVAVHTHWPTFVLGAATLILYLLLKRKVPHLPIFAISLGAMTALAYGLSKSVPAFQSVDCLPDFGFAELIPQFPEFEARSWFGRISALGGIALAIAFLAALENTVMAKNLGSRTGDRPDVNQDMFSVGMANLGCSFVGGMPASGSLTRSALNFESGAKTGFSSLFCGIFSAIATALLALTPVVSYIPKTVLAALVVAISLSLFKKGALRICFNSTNSDRAVLITTLLSTLLMRIDFAIFIGVGLSLILFLRKASQPYLVEYQLSDDGELREMPEDGKRALPAISIVHVEGNLFFGAAELFQTQIQRSVADKRLKIIILRLKNARHLDATAVSALEQLLHFARHQDRHILISGATIEVYRVLRNSGVLQVLQEGCEEGQSNLFRYHADNPNLSTRNALKRAQEILGTDEAEIKIFVDQNKQTRPR